MESDLPLDEEGADWHRRVLDRSLRTATKRSIDRGAALIRAAAKVLDRSNGDSLTVQEVADEAGQSLRTLYQYFASKEDLLVAVFEEAMRTYARMIRRSIAGFDDPLERLAAGIIAAVRIAALHHSGVDRGLSRLRLQLGQVEPEIVARSQAPVTWLFHELIEEAAAAASLTIVRPGPATYLLSAVRTSFIMSTTLGNDYGVELPDAIELSSFCLGGLGACFPREWHDSVDTRLQLTGGDRSILRRLAR